VNDLVIRPSVRKARFSLALCVLFFFAVLAFWRYVVPDAHWAILLVGVLPLIAPLMAWLDAVRTTLTLSGGIVRYKHGLLSETVRAMDLQKLQNVFVERSLSQRLWGIGNLVLESASEDGRIVINDIDRPQKIADLILDAARQEGTRP